jgi:hypothetical protein
MVKGLGLGIKVEDSGFRVLLDPRPCLFEKKRIWGHGFLGTEATFVFFPAFPCLHLGLEALFVFFCPDVAFCARTAFV